MADFVGEDPRPRHFKLNFPAQYLVTQTSATPIYSKTGLFDENKPAGNFTPIQVHSGLVDTFLRNLR